MINCVERSGTVRNGGKRWGTVRDDETMRDDEGLWCHDDGLWATVAKNGNGTVTGR